MSTLGSLNRAVRASLLTAAVMFIGYSSVVHAQSTDAFLTKYMAAVNIRMPPSGDPATVAELFTEDGVQYHVFGEPPGGPQRGREALARFFGGFKEAFADWTHIERSRFIQGNWAVWEGTAGDMKEKRQTPQAADCVLSRVRRPRQGTRRQSLCRCASHRRTTEVSRCDVYARRAETQCGVPADFASGGVSPAGCDPLSLTSGAGASKPSGGGPAARAFVQRSVIFGANHGSVLCCIATFRVWPCSSGMSRGSGDHSPLTMAAGIPCLTTFRVKARAWPLRRRTSVE